jgi:hypothetical protein
LLGGAAIADGSGLYWRIKTTAVSAGITNALIAFDLSGKFKTDWSGWSSCNLDMYIGEDRARGFL